MQNVSRNTLKSVISKNLQSQFKPHINKIMREAGVNPNFKQSLKGHEAKKVMMALKEKGLLKSSVGHVTAQRFGEQLVEAGKPQGPNPNVVKARKLSDIRERMLEEEKQKAKISDALARKPGAPGAAAPKSTARAGAPLVGGNVIGKAAQDATRPGGAGTGGFSGAGHVEPGRTPEKLEKPDVGEAIDPYGED